MSAYWLGLGSALWLGLLTSISPCPLATNIAAVSFVAKRLGKPREVLVSGLLYTAGRAALYTLLGALLVFSVVASPHLSHFLQKYMNQLLGPILILAGMLLLDLIALPIRGLDIGERFQNSISKSQVWMSFVIGGVFALSFCPVSAALFFGSLVPLAIRFESPLLMPVIYGIGTAMPVLVFVCMLTVGAQSVSRMFAVATSLDRWGRLLTGAVFIAAGIYLSLIYIFGMMSGT